MVFFILLPVLVIIGILFYVHYLFLRNLRDLLRAVNEQNRAMSPGLVWLNWIPVFSMGWMIVTVWQVRASAKAECRYRGVGDRGDQGFVVGMIFACEVIVSELLAVFGQLGSQDTMIAVGSINGVLGIAGLVCWILYWVRTSDLKTYLLTTGPVLGSAGAPRPPGYTPQSWQVPAEPEPQRSSLPEEAGPPLGGQSQAAATAAVTMPVVQTPTNTIIPGATGQPPAAQAAPATSPAGQPPAVPPAVCPSCGTSGHHVGGFCRSCGRSVVAVWPTAEASAGATAPTTGVGPVVVGADGAASAGVKCAFCGAPRRPDATFCSSCGRPLS